MSTERPLNLRPCCLNLRHKMMYVDPRQAAPGMVDDGSDTRVFWCHATQHALGPDDQRASPSACGSPGRACFQGAARPLMPTISAPGAEQA